MLSKKKVSLFQTLFVMSQAYKIIIIIILSFCSSSPKLWSYFLLVLSTGPANHHSQTTLRPPLPPPHNHHTLSHQSANSLNRNTLRGGRNPIHAPAPGTGDGPTTPESVQLQDSWVLNSNVPLETR